MVRVFLKGGVWKNSEDEILKAAVQKYGKQQWARVASLMNRKSAKQCKARWHEWLDPMVRKVEWSREEEEKLLHLAKLMPAQWKTVGPLVGRTATQCQEHYEALLDQAAAGAEGGEDGGAEGGLRAQPLRVGQIDSHPESKPARPDPIDMDEDEIEMLQEARARLANTQGKKAKRKAREKMLVQAKRLSELQKRRELKQAGLLSSAAKKKSKSRREIDLGVEIPFHKPAPAGFHDVTSEVAKTDSLRSKQQRSVDFKKLNEQQYRSRDRQASQAKKREEARLRSLEKSNMQYVVAQVSKTNDPLNIRKRGPLKLPEPTVTDKELKELAKMDSQSNGATPELVGGSGATQTLLADYSDRPLPTPMRTPMTGAAASRQKSILREASNLRMLERGQTPLLGGGGDDMEEDDEEQEPTQPGDNAATPAARPGTPGGPLRPQTPRRDHFGLNRPHSELRGGTHDDGGSVGASTFATGMSIREIAREERRAAKLARKQLEEALAALPVPQFEYELEAPMDIDEEETKVETVMEEDLADVEAAERRRLQKEAERLYEARSSVVKRSELPRPVGAIPDMDLEDPEESPERLLDEERLTLLRHDAHAFPVKAPPSFLDDKKKKKKSKSKGGSTTADLPPETPLDYIPDNALTAAKQMIQDELQNTMDERMQPLLANGKSLEEAKEALLQATLHVRILAAEEVYVGDGKWIQKTEESECQSHSIEFDALQEGISALRKKNEKAESKLVLLTGGLVKRVESSGTALLQTYGDLRNALIEQAVYENMRGHEEPGCVRRMDRLRQDVAWLQQDEARLQEIYQDLSATAPVQS
jgi:pre-mRNA-splicing factor CDC5/CEF1